MNQKKSYAIITVYLRFHLARWLSNKKYVEALGIHNHIQITLFRCLKARQENLIVIITFINSDKISTRNNNKKDDPNWAGWLLKDTSSFDASWLRNAPKGWNNFAIFRPASLHQWLLLLAEDSFLEFRYVSASSYQSFQFQQTDSVFPSLVL